MTTPTTSTTTAAPATGTAAPAAGQATGTATPADPAAGALFTALLQSLGGPALVTGSTTTATGEPALPGDLAEEATDEDGSAETATPTDATGTLVPLLPSVLLVPLQAAVTVSPTGGDATEGSAATAPAGPAVLDVEAGPTAPAVAVPVSPAALVAVADALPLTAVAPTPDEPAEPVATTDSTRGSDDGEGAMPLPNALSATATTSAATAAAALAPTAVPVATTAAAAAQATSTEPTAAATPASDRTAERTKDRASASDQVATAPAGDGQANAAAAVSVSGGDTAADAVKADAAASTTAPVDHERFERLADGLAARLRVSLAGDGARVRMHLTPRELGEVVVRLELKDGLATAHLIADNADASRMLTAAMGDLRSALADRGLRLDSVNVRVSGDAGGPMQGHTGPRQEGHGREQNARAFSFGRLDAAQAVEGPTPLVTSEAATHGVSVLA